MEILEMADALEGVARILEEVGAEGADRRITVCRVVVESCVRSLDGIAERLERLEDLDLLSGDEQVDAFERLGGLEGRPSDQDGPADLPESGSRSSE